MKKLRTPEAIMTSFVLLLTFATIHKPLGAAFITPVLAQSATGATAAPDAETVRIDGSSSMKVTNEIRQQQLEQRSPGADTKVSYNGTDAALQSVLDGETDLAAVGRPLTAEEKAQGLVVAPQKRHKIAIVVGSENPFKGELTFDQFAQIFRGEITDWSEVGGSPGAIQLIDRPETNDTRQALQRYDIFKRAPFVASASALKLSDDSTDAMTQELGTRGISYAIADQVTDTPGVRIVPMHGTLPSDPRYPYSQPLAYVYKGPANSAVAAFLGIAAAPAPASSIVPALPEVASVPAQAPAQVTEDEFPWWLLLLPLLVGGLWWLLKRSRPAPASAPIAAPPVAPIPPAPVAPIAPVPVTSVTPVAPAILNGHSQDIKLYEERLVVDLHRRKVGEVVVRKEIETHIVEVPIRREKLIVEQVSPKYEQIAVVELGQVQLTEFNPLVDFANLSPTLSGNFASVSEAIQFLQAIAAPSNSSLKTVQVSIESPDKNLQEICQKWLEQHSNQSSVL